MQKLMLMLVLATACGTQELHVKSDSKSLEERLLALEGTVSQLNDLVNSDFATCPASGDTSDALIRKICQVAQASTVESQVRLKAELMSFSQQLSNKLDTLTAENGRIVTDIASIEATLTSLDGRMTSAESAISVLQSTIASINGVLNGTMAAVDIGNENVSAGPVYETVLRRSDKTRINAYVDAYGAGLSLPNNPGTTTNGSPNVVFTFNSHGYLVNDIVQISGLSEGNGFSSGHLVGEFKITATTTNTFTVQLATNATSNGTFGGGNGVAKKVLGRGMANIWKTADGADASVRMTTLGNKRYNFIVKANGDICYDTTNASATFGTIDSGGVNITCK